MICFNFTSSNKDEDSPTKKRPKLSEATYVSFGDSVTAIYNPNYPDTVGEILGLKKVNNLAVSGSTYVACGRTNMTQTILSFKGKADIISIMLGVNDYDVKNELGNKNSRDNNTIYGSIYLICEYLSKNYSDSFVFFVTPHHWTDAEAKNDKGYTLEDLADAVIYVAGQYNIPVYDLYRNGGYTAGLHPTQAQHNSYTAPKIAEFISKHY